jgi:hypothetical protein
MGKIDQSWRSICSLALVSLAGCLPQPEREPEPKPPPIVLTAQEQECRQSERKMLAKFGGLGAELVISYGNKEELKGVQLFAPCQTKPFASPGDMQMGFKNGEPITGGAYRAFPGAIPERVRVVWYSEYGWDKVYVDTQVGTIKGEETIEVGSRIPQELIDELKRDPKGGINIKFRSSDQGMMFGWDLERRPGYELKERGRDGSLLYIPPFRQMSGGDFKEARKNYYTPEGKFLKGGAVWEKGWYIDKKTGKKIEVDY